MRTHLLTTAALLAGLLVACDGSSGTDGGTTPDPDAGTPSAARGRDNPPTVGAQIDRNGRPAISTATLATFTPDETRNARRADYAANADPSTWTGDYLTDIASTLAILDGLDTVCGNQLLAAETLDEDRYATLATVLSDDRLWVNAASGENGSNLYLGVEAEAVSVLPAGGGGAGGRRPTDDVIDRSYSVLAAGILTGVDDTIAGDDADQSDDTFPFLAAPL